MRISAMTKKAVAIVVGAAIIPVASAGAQNGLAAAPDRAGPAVETEHHDQVVLRRDPDRAVPFDPVIGTRGMPVLHRDGSQAEPFVAEIGPTANSPGTGFDWGDALIGAGVAYAAILLATGAVVLIRRRRPRQRLAQRPA